MKTNFFLYSFLLLTLYACTTPVEVSYPEVQVAGAMKNVMRKGELDAIIQLNQIEPQEGLYAIGPLAHLRGEILINDGKAFVSRVATDTSMTVEATCQVGAPFLVYGHVNSWQETTLPNTVTDIVSLEAHVSEITQNHQRPFIFKLRGEVIAADIHIQNLPMGTQVSSPEEAHQGQVNYSLQREMVEIIGFFSTEHQGIFTHHDTYVHLHLITADSTKMGHLDHVTFSPKRIKLYLPAG